MRISASLRLGAALVAAAPTADATAAGDTRRDGAPAYYVAVELVYVHTVVRHLARPVGGLTADDFILLEDGRPVSIDFFENRGTSIDLYVLIDVSRSMRDDLGSVRKATRAFIAGLGDEDRVSLITFNHDVVSETALSGERAPARAALDGLESRGGTAMYAAVEHALARINRTRRRSAIVVFSDGRDPTRDRLPRILHNALILGVAIYTIQVEDRRLTAEARRDIEALTEQTGGRAQFISGARKLRGSYDAILDELRSRYVLAFTPSPGPPGQRRIEVRARDHRYEVRSRSSFVHGKGVLVD